VIMGICVLYVTKILQYYNDNESYLLIKLRSSYPVEVHPLEGLVAHGPSGGFHFLGCVNIHLLFNVLKLGFQYPLLLKEQILLLVEVHVFNLWLFNHHWLIL